MKMCVAGGLFPALSCQHCIEKPGKEAVLDLAREPLGASLSSISYWLGDFGRQSFNFFHLYNGRCISSSKDPGSESVKSA